MLRQLENRADRQEDQNVQRARTKFHRALTLRYQNVGPPDYTNDVENYPELMPVEGMSHCYQFLIPREKSIQPPTGRPTLVMKLFDRGINLAEVHLSTPIYPICREWIRNKPYEHQQEQEKEQEADDNLDSSPGRMEVCQLPSPSEPLPGNYCASRVKIPVPVPLPQGDGSCLLINSVDEQLPLSTILFKGHLDRWATIKERWKRARWENEKRYKNSFDILEQIHGRTSLSIEMDDEIETSLAEVVEQ